MSQYVGILRGGADLEIGIGELSRLEQELRSSATGRESRRALSRRLSGAKTRVVPQTIAYG